MGEEQALNFLEGGAGVVLSSSPFQSAKNGRHTLVLKKPPAHWTTEKYRPCLLFYETIWSDGTIFSEAKNNVTELRKKIHTGKFNLIE